MVKKAKGGRIKKQIGGVMPGVGGAGVQSPLGGGALPGARMIKKGGKVSKAKGGRVKAMAGGMKAKKKK